MRTQSREYQPTLPYIGSVRLDPEDLWWVAVATLVPPTSVLLVLGGVLPGATAGILSATALLIGSLTLYHGRRQARLARARARQQELLDQLAERGHVEESRERDP